MVKSVGPENNPFEALGKPPKKFPYDGAAVSSTYITMRDGVKIAATICLPKGLKSGDKIPTLLYQITLS